MPRLLLDFQADTCGSRARHTLLIVLRALSCETSGLPGCVSKSYACCDWVRARVNSSRAEPNCSSDATRLLLLSAAASVAERKSGEVKSPRVTNDAQREVSTALIAFKVDWVFEASSSNESKLNAMACTVAKACSKAADLVALFVRCSSSARISAERWASRGEK